MKALVFDNKVVDMAETPFEVHSSMTWMDAPEGCEAGWLLEDGQLVNWDKRTPEQRAADDLEQLRMQRNKKLRKTDHWAMADREMPEAMRAYRQALRDITSKYSNVNEVVWPEVPNV